MKYYQLDGDPDQKIISGLCPSRVVTALKEPWNTNKTNRQYMKDFRLRAINIYGEEYERIRINSCRNFIQDLVRFKILTPVDDPMT